jgi:O-succinylbenzoate synthase
MLQVVRPDYLVLKPSLLGGLHVCEQWMLAAKESGTGYWITSMLESNVGLNALAQWTATKSCTVPQGLGTGMLYRCNFPSLLQVCDGYLKYLPPPELPVRDFLSNLTLS